MWYESKTKVKRKSNGMCNEILNKTLKINNLKKPQNYGK